jgi:hypothetical protein
MALMRISTSIHSVKKVTMTIKKQADETFGWGIGLEKEAEFEKAKAIYEDLSRHVTDETVLRKIRFRIGGHRRPDRREGHLPAH